MSDNDESAWQPRDWVTAAPPEAFRKAFEEMTPDAFQALYEQEWPFPDFSNPETYDRARRDRLVEALVHAHEALKNVTGYLDTPVARRRAKGDWMYQPVVDSVRHAMHTIQGINRR